jgi:acyl-CoA thioester hydrolase
VGEPFAHSLRVRFAECDSQGVVFNAHYLAYLDMGMTELCRAAFGSYQAMLDRGIDMVVVEAQLRFHTPARFDDELRLEIGISRMGNTSISSAHRVVRGVDLIAQGALHHVFVSRQTLNKTTIPDWVRTPLTQWLAPAGAAGPGSVSRRARRRTGSRSRGRPRDRLRPPSRPWSP